MTESLRYIPIDVLFMRKRVEELIEEEHAERVPRAPTSLVKKKKTIWFRAVPFLSNIESSIDNFARPIGHLWARPIDWSR